VEEPAMPVRPVHHRGDGEFSIDINHLFTDFRYLRDWAD
jgi:hypothetical protein